MHPSTRWTADYKDDGPYDELLWEIDGPGSKEEVSREVVHGEVADEKAGSLQLIKVDNYDSKLTLSTTCSCSRLTMTIMIPMVKSS